MLEQGTCAFRVLVLQSQHQRRAAPIVAPLGRRVALQEQDARIDLPFGRGEVEWGGAAAVDEPCLEGVCRHEAQHQR